MQIMPSTAKWLGVDPKLLTKPEISISLGCHYDWRLYSALKEIYGKRRRPLLLALNVIDWLLCWLHTTADQVECAVPDEKQLRFPTRQTVGKQRKNNPLPPLLRGTAHGIR